MVPIVPFLNGTVSIASAGLFIISTERLFWWNDAATVGGNKSKIFLPISCGVTGNTWMDALFRYISFPSSSAIQENAGLLFMNARNLVSLATNCFSISFWNVISRATQNAMRSFSYQYADHSRNTGVPSLQRN